MNNLLISKRKQFFSAGMEMVQVAILIAIAIAAGLIFREKIGDFIKDVFGSLNESSFTF